MLVLKRSVLFLALLGMVSACATPQVAEPVSEANKAQDCATLTQEIQHADALRVAAREEDKFQWKYIFVVNGFVSAYRINKAEGAAEDRIAGLKAIAQEKGCKVPPTNAPQS